MTTPINFASLGLRFDPATRTYHVADSTPRVVEVSRAAPRCRVATIQTPRSR